MKLWVVFGWQFQKQRQTLSDLMLRALDVPETGATRLVEQNFFLIATTPTVWP